MKYGIYQIRNLINNKCYIGSAAGKGFNNRWKSHINDLKKQKHHSSKLQNAWNKYGIENFIFEVLLCCDPKNCLFYEQIALDYYKPEYNICSTAGSTFGLRYSAESKLKISNALKGKYSGYKSPHFGRLLSNQTKEKIRTANFGKIASNETRVKMSQSRIKNINSRIFTQQQIKEIRNLLKDGVSQRRIALLFGVSPATICNIKNNKTYGDSSCQ